MRIIKHATPAHPINHTRFRLEVVLALRLAGARDGILVSVLWVILVSRNFLSAVAPRVGLDLARALRVGLPGEDEYAHRPGRRGDGMARRQSGKEEQRDELNGLFALFHGFVRVAF